VDCIARNKAYNNDTERIVDIFVLLVAGHDTTAYTLAWTLIELAKNPQEQLALQKELNKMPTDKRHKTPMLENVIKESMRLYPVAAGGSGRTSNKDIIVKRNDDKDILIPKGSELRLAPIVVHRMEEYYEDPDKFKPSRWEDPSEKALAAFIPFALGRRNCIGQSLAKAELHSVLARLCAEFYFDVKDEGISRMNLTMQPQGATLIVSRCIVDKIE